MTQKSDEYEKLVKDVHQGLLNKDGFENIQIQHNVKITGKSGASHQIDVYWEFKLAGILYRTCIECKDYKNKVTKSQVAAFAKITEDIGRNVNGIIATTEGFQTGAKQFAAHYNIRLVCVNPLIKTIATKFTLKIPAINNLVFKVDKEHFNNLLLKAGVSTFSSSINGLSDEIFFCDENGHQIMSLKEVIGEKTNSPGEHEIPLNNVYYSTEIGVVKLNSILLNIIHNELQTESIVNVNSISRAVIEDVIANNKQYLNDDGTIEE